MNEPEDRTLLYSLLSRPVIAVPIVLVLVAILVAAVAVVVKNAGRVQIGPAPVPLGPLPKDTTLLKSRRSLMRGIERLERRLAEYRQKVDTLKPPYDSLFNLYNERVALLWRDFASIEAAGSYNERRERLMATRQNYVQVRTMVNEFLRSIDSIISGSTEDSLDREFKKLLNE